MEANVAYFLDDDLISWLTYFVSIFWVQKCCSNGHVFSLSKNGCQLKDEKESSKVESVFEFLLNRIRYLLVPPAPFEFEKAAGSHFRKFWQNGTWCYANRAKAVCFQPGQYCFDFVAEQKQFMLLNGTRLNEEFNRMELAWEALKQFAFLLSLLLALVTLALYLFLPALHQRVYDKFLICYLISVTATVVTIYVFTILGIMKEIHKLVFCNAFRIFLLMSIIFWLNVICVHLWRSVRSMNRMRKMKLLHYAIYAWGCSLIVSGVETIQRFVDLPILREIDGKWYDLKEMICIIVLLVNLCLFLHIVFIIWRQKNQWKGNSESRRHIKKQRRRTFQILKLFLIMGILEWNNFFSCAFRIRLGISSKLYVCISQFLSMCPGYVIFFVFVVGNKRVTSVLKRRFTRRRPAVAHSKMSALKIVERPDVRYNTRKMNSQACLLESD